MLSSAYQGSKRFKCKYSGCIYSEGSQRYFEKHQYLKQHYDKVHAEKVFMCPLCPKSFSTTTLMKSHLKYCGKEFNCSCGVVYKSNEALLTHAKRKQHALGAAPRTTEIAGSSDSSRPQILKINSNSACVVVIHPSYHSKVNTEIPTRQSDKQVETSLHVMAAVALSELASTKSLQIPESLKNKMDSSTQTEHSSPDEWLSFVCEDLGTNSKINNSGTQTDDLRCTKTVEASQGPGSPWLGLCAETQTADEEELRPFNLCDIQTQTPWAEMDEDSTEFTHTETQTLLSSLFIEPTSIQNSTAERERSKNFLNKQNSEDAATDPMEDL